MARTKAVVRKAPAGKKAAVKKKSTKKAVVKKDTTTPTGRLPRAAKSKAQETSYIESDHSEEEPEQDDEDSGDDSGDNGSNFSSEDVEVEVVKKEVPQKSDVPGFNVWKTGTKLASGKELTEVSQYDISISSFKQTVQILHNEMFTLKPLIFNEGPLKGRRVLVVEPTVITEYFPFLKLPPELRKMVYDVLFLDPNDGKMSITTYKPVGQPRRAVRPEFRDTKAHKGLVWDKTFGKWIDQPPSEFSLLCVSKQLFQETAPVAYGSDTFEFSDIKCATIFLKSIGGMRQHLKNLRFTDTTFGSTRIIYTLFSLLKDAKSLRTLKIPHKVVCGKDLHYGYYGRWRSNLSLETLVSIARPMLKAVILERRAREDPTRVVELLVLEPPSACYACKNTSLGPACVKMSYGTACKDATSHHEEVALKLKNLVRKEFTVKQKAKPEPKPKVEVPSELPDTDPPPQSENELQQGTEPQSLLEIDSDSDVEIETV